jgi:hypothetical protein
VLAFGWAGTSLGIITNTLGLWFDKKRGMAISLALNGASFGGVVGVPLLVAAVGTFGFSGAMIASAIVLVVLMVPVILLFVGQPPVHASMGAVAEADAPSPTQIRARAFRDLGFLSVSIAFALVLFAQVGFIVHLISFLDAVIGRERAAVAVALLTAMAVVGRVLFSTVIDRLNQRLASALSFLSQAVEVFGGQLFDCRLTSESFLLPSTRETAERSALKKPVTACWPLLRALKNVLRPAIISPSMALRLAGRDSRTNVTGPRWLTTRLSGKICVDEYVSVLAWTLLTSRASPISSGRVRG